MSISLALAGQNLLSGIPPSCALWLREMYFFVTAPARLDLGLPRRTALQGFAQIRVHSRAKFSGLRSQISGFFPSVDPRLGIDSNCESQPTKISFAKDMTRGEQTCMDSR